MLKKPHIHILRLTSLSKKLSKRVFKKITTIATTMKVTILQMGLIIFIYFR
jgi:hypothetical protein